MKAPAMKSVAIMAVAVIVATAVGLWATTLSTNGGESPSPHGSNLGGGLYEQPLLF